MLDRSDNTHCRGGGGSIVTRFGKILEIFGKFVMVYLAFGLILSLLRQSLNTIGQIFINISGQILNTSSGHTGWKYHCTAINKFLPLIFSFLSTVMCLKFEQPIKML